MKVDKFRTTAKSFREIYSTPPRLKLPTTVLREGFSVLSTGTVYCERVIELTNRKTAAK
jgi:hypothetical protein